MKIDRQFFERMGALESVVLFPDCDIKEELAKMSPEDARAAKRKWRKLMRRAEKIIQERRGNKRRSRPPAFTKNRKKHIVRGFLSDLGKSKLKKETK